MENNIINSSADTEGLSENTLDQNRAVTGGPMIGPSAMRYLLSEPKNEDDYSARVRGKMLSQIVGHAIAIAKRDSGNGTDAPEEKDAKERATADAIGTVLSGKHDYYGAMWNGGRPFASGTDYAAHMRDLVLNGPQTGLTDEAKEFYEADYETQVKLALKHEGALDTAKRAAADVLDGMRTVQPLSREEEASADEETRAASATVAVANMGGTTVDEEKFSAAKEKVSAFREKQRMEAVRQKYEAKLNRDNAWNALTSILPTLSEDAQKCAKAIMDSPNNSLPFEYYAKFNALTQRERELVIQTRQLTKDKVDSGFWNTIGDAAIETANITSSILTAPWRQGSKYEGIIRDAATGSDAAGIAVNELAVRRQLLWQATGDFLAGGDLAHGELPQLQFERVCEEHGLIGESVIGAISTLPYMGAAMIPVIGTPLIALEAMQEFDDHVALNGGDITDRRYLWSSFVMGGLYAYVEKLQVENLVGGLSEQKIREGMLKGFWGGIKNGTVPRVLTSKTLSESLQEGLQNGVMAVNNAYALKEDAVRAFGEAFVDDFVGSLGTMAIIGGGGLVIGHMGRSGMHFRGKEINGKLFSASELRWMERNVNLDQVYSGIWAHNNMVEAMGRTKKYMENEGNKELARLFPFWQEGGKEALIEKGGVGKEDAERFDSLFSDLRNKGDANKAYENAVSEWNRTRGIEKSPETGESGEIEKRYFEDLAVRYGNGEMSRDDFTRKLVEIGFSEAGALDVSSLIDLETRLENTRESLGEYFLSKYASEHGTDESRSEDMKKVARQMRDLDNIRNVWARGLGIYRKDEDGTVQDPGAKALEEFGFMPEYAEKLSRLFHAERAAAYSRIALDGIRAMYEKATRGMVSGKAAIASEFKGRVVRMPTGTDEKGKTTYGDFIRFNLPKNGGEAYVQIVETPRITVDTKRNSVFVARSIAERTKGFKNPITVEQWMDATPEERDRLIDEYGLTSEGYFLKDNDVCLILEGDPSVRVDETQAKRIVFGTINLATDSNITSLNQLSVNDDGSVNGLIDSSAGFHEVYHAWRQFMVSTGQWTKEDEARLAAKYGKDSDGNHDEEAAANAMRGYMNRRVEGRMTAEDEASPFRKIYALAMRLIRRGKEKKVKDRIAANAEEAFFDQIIADRFSGVGELVDKKPTTTSSGDGKTGTSTEPQLPGRKESGTDSGATGTGTEKPVSGTEKTESRTEKPPATPKPAAQRGWTAYTPTGNVKVSGHYAVVNLADVIHSNNPAYALYMRAQLRNRKDNKAEEDTRKDIVNNFQGERLLEAPDTANGAPIVFVAPDEKGVNRMFVLSGNGRILVLNELAERHLYDQYRNVMKAWAAENGLEVPEGDTPVLVRVITDFGGATREKVADLSNTNSIQQYTEEEQARADAEVIKALDIAKLYHANANGTADMTPGVNDDFFSEFIRGVGDTSLYNSDRSLTETARTRAVRALLAIAVGQGDRGRDVVKKLIEQTDTLNIARQKNAAAIMAAAVAALESKAEYSIGPDVSRAMADFIDFAEKKKAGRIGTFDEYFGQMDLLDEPSEIAKEVLKLFGSKQSAADIAEYVVVYCEAAAQEDPSGGLFGAEGARSRLDIWNDAKKLVEERRAAGGAAKHSISASEDPGIAKPYELITADEMDLIAEETGTTDDPLDVGFILPDGRMVKYLSHVACVSPVIFKRGLRFSDMTGYRMVGTALKSGMVRTGGLSRAWIQLGAKPTERQRDAIRDYIEAQRKASNYSDLTVEVEGKDNVFHSATYSLKVNPSRVFEEIDNFYDNGVEPNGQSKLSIFFRWSIAAADFSAVSKYYEGDARDIVRGIKLKDETSVALAAGIMARAVPKGAVLVPVPGHFGRADDTYALANAIARITGSPVVEALRGSPRMSIYEQKQEGYLPSAGELGFYKYDEPPADREVIFIDNVVGTGTTSVAAREALGRGRVLAFAWDNTAPRPIGIVGGLEESKHSISSQKKVSSKEWKEAAKYYGTTEDPFEAGYMLPDGRMLDFSEKNNGGSAGMRSLDHRNIGAVIKREDQPGEQRQAMADAILSGAIRMHPESPGFNIGKMPTSDQWSALRSAYDYYREADRGWGIKFDLVRGDNFYDIFSVSYNPQTSFERVKNDIKAFYEEGAEPEGTMDGDAYYSFAAGEIGSANMQNALFLSANLDKARQMLGKRDWAKIPRKDRLAIKIATGWEKGADGKWRLEIMDLPKFDMSKLSKPNPDYADMTINESNGDPSKSSKYMPVKLGAIWSKKDQKAIDLFAAYPWIKDVTVAAGTKMTRENVRGLFYEEKMTIFLNDNIHGDEKNIREIFTHEIQHIIQGIEDFARGGNTTVARLLFLKKFVEAGKLALDLYQEQNRIAGELLDDHGYNNKLYFFKWPKKSIEHQHVLNTLRERWEWQDFELRAAEFKRKYGHQFSYFIEEAGNANEIAMRQQYDDYTKFAGEVEARNAAKRQYSLFTLLEDTEDTERRYQKLIDENMKEFQRITEALEEAEKHSFAGLRGANVAGVKSIDDAEVMERRGDDRETIYRLTGWYRGTDGLWRVELPFHGRFVFEGDFDGGAQKGYRTVSDYFDWPELFQAYPELRDVEVRFEDLPEDVRGDFDPKTKTIRIANDVRRGGSGILARHRVAPVMVHEIQHAIQSIENHARGGDPEDLLTWDRTKVHDEIRRLSLARDLAETQEEKNELSEMIAEHEHNLKVDAEEAARRYYRLAGEVEARNAANRFYMSPSERFSTPPWETEEVEREKQILDFSEEDEVRWDNVEKGPLHSFAARLETVRQDIREQGGDIYLAYHGTRKGGFTIFDNTKNDYAQPGFYFAKDRDTAMTYSSEMYDPFDETDDMDEIMSAMVEDNALYNKYGIYNVALKIMKPLVIDCGGEKWRRVPNPFDPNGGVETTREVTRIALASGRYDGVIFKNVVDYGPGYLPTPATDVYVVRDPEQIKVVDAVTYDDEKNIIPDAERLDWTSPDIRHSIASAWGENFPNVMYVTTRKYVKADAELDRLHHEAKAGSLPSALAFVERLMPDEPNRPNEKERIRKIKQLAADYPDAWIVPVRAIEATGDNMLPFAYARRIHQITGLPVSDSIKQSAKAGHTGATAEERFFSRAEFDGYVKRGREYILVDDHVTMGGTLAELRKHIVNRGGKVVAATTLTVSKFSDKLSPRDETLQKLIAKFGEDFPTLLKKAGVADGLAELSEYEAAYLLKFSPDRLRDLVARASDDLSQQVSRRHGPGYAGRVRERSAGAGRLGEVPRVDGGVHGPSERGTAVQVRDVRRASAGRPETSDVIPGFDDYVDPATGEMGETRFAKTPLFRGHISRELNAVIDESDESKETGEEALKKLISLIERAKETPEGKILIARYREGNSYNGTETERQDPKRKAVWDSIIKELLDAPITANNNEGLEIDKKTGKPKNAYTVEASNAAHPELPAISNDENAKYYPVCGRRLDIVIGPPAAGKSSVFVNKLSIFHRSRVLDSDAIKKRLPGFDKGNGASYVHEESSALNKLIIGMLLDRNLGENVVLPIVGANAKKVLDYIEKFRDAGYSIHLHNNYVPILHAFGRSLNRTMSTGRWISPDVFTGCMDAPSAVFEEIRNRADFWDEFDNDGPRYMDPLYVRGNYVDQAYGKILKKSKNSVIFGKNGVWTNAMLDPQMMFDFSNAMDAEENKTPLFPPRLRQLGFDFGPDPEGRAKHAIRSDLRENRDKAATEALTNWITYFRLSHGSVPMTKTIARMGLAMGMSVVDSKRILQASETRAEQMRGSLIEKAAQNGDIATTMALLKREDGINEAVGNLLAGGVAKGGELTHRGVGQINTIIGKRVEQMMRDFTAASLADMEGETGLDIAAEILEQNPDAFADEIKGAKGTDPDAPADANDEQPSDADATAGDGGAIDESELSDLERFNREQARKEALKKVEEFIAKAKAKAAENKAKAEERRRRAEENGEGSGSGDGMGGGDPGIEDMEQAISKAMGGTNPKNVKANFKTKEEFAAFMRVWAEYKFDKTHGITTLGKTQRDKLFAEFYRITVRQELQDLADKLLAPKDEAGVTISRIAKLGNGARNVVSRQIARMEKGLRPDTIERMSANIFGFINSAAIRVSRTDLVNEFKKEIKDKYIKGEKYEDLKLDSDRRVTGWVEEAARYICRVCDLSKRSINGDITQLAAERKELLDIINRRADVYDESGKDVARAAVEDMETKKAMWKLALLDKYGAMTSLMPGEILDLRKAAFEYLENQAADLERLWRDTRAYEDGIRKDLTLAIVAPNGQRYQEKGWLDGRLFDALNGLIRLRLHHLTRFADEATQKQAKNAINKILVLLGDGETAYNRMLQDDRQALFEGLARIFNRNGRADNAAIKKYLNRMTEPIPVELAKQISNQGFVGTMTYGQMLQLLVSLEQRSFKDAIEHNGRQGQAELIRTFTTTDKDGKRVNVFTAEDNMFIEWLRAFYAAKRDVISPVTLRMVGQQVESPDPLYCPIKRSMEDRVQALAEAGSTWDPIAAVFTRRLKNNRDFDEQASILGMFFDRSNETAKLVAWAERGTIIRGVFTNVGVQSAIRRAFGPGELRKIMTQLLATFNGGESKKRNPGELAAVDKALNFTTYAYLGFNPLSSLKQTTSFTVWANALPGGFKDLWKYMTHFDAKVLKHLKESDEYRVRYGNEVGSGQDMATKGLNENPSMNPVVRMLSGAGMWMLKKADFAPGGWIAQGVYKDMLDKHMQEGMSFDEADRLAITETFNMLEETQQSGRVYNTNMLTLEHGRIGRLLTQFATSPLQQLQYETQAWREWRDMVRYGQGEKKIAAARQKLVRAAVINHLLIPAALNFVTAVYKKIMGDEPPWEQDGYHWTLLTEILMGQFSRVFFIGAFAQTSLNALFSREYPRGSQILPVEGALGMAASLCITAHDVAVLDAEKVRKDVERLLKSTAPTRIPYSIYRRLTGDADVDRKKAKDKAKRKR